MEWSSRHIENIQKTNYKKHSPDLQDQTILFLQKLTFHNHFCRSSHTAEFCRILQNPVDFCRILQKWSSESACCRDNGGLTPKCFVCVFFFVSWIFQTSRRLLSIPNDACCANRRKPVIFCRIKNPRLLQNENRRNSAEIEILQKPIDSFRLGKNNSPEVSMRAATAAECQRNLSTTIFHRFLEGPGI